MTNKAVLAAILVVAVVAAFFAGSYYQQQQTMARFQGGGFGQGRGFGQGGVPGQGARPGGPQSGMNGAPGGGINGPPQGGAGRRQPVLSGRLDKADDTQLTLTTNFGSVKVVLGKNTKVEGTQAAQISDLKAGQQVIIQGTTDRNGQFTSKSVIISGK